MQAMEMDRQRAVSVDISNGGMGIITGRSPLQQGHVLTFENEIAINTSYIKKGCYCKMDRKNEQ